MNRVCLLPIVLAPMILSACQSRETNRYTPPPAVRTDSLYSFEGQTAEALADRLAQIPQIKNSPRKVVVAFGELQNLTSGTPTSDLITIREKLGDSLTNSDFFRRQATLVGDLRQFERLKAEFSGINRGPGAQTETGGAQGAAGITYDPQDVYILDGFFGEIKRPTGGSATPTSTYQFVFKLTHLQTAQQVFSQAFTSKEER
ncbi:hypothetical protein BH11PLA1_BH11PLA1_20920 [soil metagenome]